jgi:hypothetical protein
MARKRGQSINVGGFTSMATMNAVLVQWPDDVTYIHELAFQVAAITRNKMFEFGLLEHDDKGYDTNGRRPISLGGYKLSGAGKRTRTRRRFELDAVMAKKP